MRRFDGHSTTIGEPPHAGVIISGTAKKTTRVAIAFDSLVALFSVGAECQTYSHSLGFHVHVPMDRGSDAKSLCVSCTTERSTWHEVAAAVGERG
jgi:hypothetical protein